LPRHPLLFILLKHKEEGNYNLLSLPSLFQHYRRRQRRIVVIFFFSNTKKTKKQKKPRERKELIFKLSLCPLTFGSRFYPFISNDFSWHLLLPKQEKKNTKKKKP
jgi:hypothetical protein